MKKFFLKLTYFSIPFVILLILNSLYMHTDYWQNENNIKKFYTMPYNVQLANVGSSHGLNSFDYKVVPEYTGANLGLINQRHDMSYLVLNQYIDHMSENAVLLITISYFEITSTDSNFESMIAAYYRILSPKLIPDYSTLQKIRFDLFPILSAGRNMSKIFPSKFAPFTIKHKNKQTESIKRDRKEIAEQRYKGFTNPNADKGEEGFAYNQQAVAKIIDLCHEHNIKPVLITTPITDVLNEYFDNTEGFFDTFYRFIDAVKEKYPDIPYFDYSHDERFSPDYTLFYDTDHLNTAGAEKFTRIVVDDLEQAGLLVK